MDIIDRIDELVDEQLDSGEDVSDYLTGDHAYPRCPHCDRHWHGLPLTSRVAWMYTRRWMDPNYDADTDDSPIICDGSDFIGPQRPPAPEQGNIGSRRELPFLVLIDTDALSAGLRRIQERWDHFFDQIATNWRVTVGEHQTIWSGRLLLQHHTEQETGYPTPDIEVTFGPQNWIHEIRRSAPPAQLQFPRQIPGWISPLDRQVGELWMKFTAPDFPVPPSPGYDFSAYAQDIQHGPQHNQILRGRS